MNHETQMHYENSDRGFLEALANTISKADKMAIALLWQEHHVGDHVTPVPAEWVPEIVERLRDIARRSTA